MIIGGTRNDNNKRAKNENCIEYIYCQNDLNFSKIEWPLDGISFDKSQVGNSVNSTANNFCFVENMEILFLTPSMLFMMYDILFISVLN